MNFKAKGSRIFEEITGANINKRLAVILDGNVYTAPNIESRIAGGRAQITLGQGQFQPTDGGGSGHRPGAAGGGPARGA